MRVEDFNVSEQCLEHIKKSGFETVEQIAELLNQLDGGTFGWADWIMCVDEIVTQLKRLDLWSEKDKNS
jgi:hypothetical protein